VENRGASPEDPTGQLMHTVVVPEEGSKLLTLRPIRKDDPKHQGTGKTKHSLDKTDETADKDKPYKRHKEHGSETVRRIRKGVG